MAIVNEIKCARCDRKYSGVRSRCPYCGARRTGYGKYSDGSDSSNTKMVVSIIVMALITTFAGVLLLSSNPAAPDPVIPDTPGTSEINSPEGDVVSQPGYNQQPEETPPEIETPTPSPTPPPEVTSVTIRYGSSPRNDEFTVKVSEKVELNVIWKPDGVVDPAIRWTSSDEEKFQVVPTLDLLKATVTGIFIETATLTVTVDDYEQTCTVHVIR